MLWQRVLTALVLLPPAVAAVLWLPQGPLSLVFAAIGLLAADEWARLSGLVGRPARLAYGAAAAAVMALMLLGPAPLRVAVLGLACLWWLWALAWVLRYPRGVPAAQPGPGLRAAFGLLVVPASIVGLLAVRAAAPGAAGLLTLFLLVWAADIGAYFTGRAFGRHKLAPAVSPGKTWEGFAGGLLAALAVGLAAARWLLPVTPAPGAWLALCAAVAAISVLGDLAESLLKRLAGVKDSGRLLPGHGGVLDRIDSLLAAAPAMAVGLHALGFWA